MRQVDIIKARFIEAADTERHLPRPMLPNGKGFWPRYEYSAEDREGWTDDTKADDTDRWARIRGASREAITRHDECLVWSMTLLPTEKHRHILWRWAFCQVNGWSFAESCKRRGWVRVTAYRRLDASCELVSNYFLGSCRAPTLPEEKYLLQFSAARSRDVIGSAPDVDAPPAIPFTNGYRTEESVDLLTTQEAVDGFQDHLSEVNERRRKARLRKALRGVPDEQEAA